VNRGVQGPKRSVLTDGAGVPVRVVSAGANRHDSPLLAPTLAGLEKRAPSPATEPGAARLDRGYDNGSTPALLAEHGVDGIIAANGCRPRCRRQPLDGRADA
jgi:hypothetical protein